MGEKTPNRTRINVVICVLLLVDVATTKPVMNAGSYTRQEVCIYLRRPSVRLSDALDLGFSAHRRSLQVIDVPTMLLHAFVALCLQFGEIGAHHTRELSHLGHQIQQR